MSFEVWYVQTIRSLTPLCVMLRPRNRGKSVHTPTGLLLLDHQHCRRNGITSGHSPLQSMEPFSDSLSLVVEVVVVVMCGEEGGGSRGNHLDLDALHRVHEGIFLPNNLDLDVRANIHVPVVFHRLLAFVFATILKS